MIIYKATNLIDGKIYIGYTTKVLDKRIEGHYKWALKYNSKLKFHNALRKYGVENFLWQVVKEYHNITLAELKEHEKEYIKLFEAHSEKGYNLTDGGDGFDRRGMKNSKESNEKRSKKLLGKKPWNKGLKMSEEFCKKEIEAHKGEKNSFYGKHHTEEFKEKQRKNKKGKKLSKEHIQNSSRARTGQKRSPETKQKMSDSGKRKDVPDIIILQLSNLGLNYSQIAKKLKCDHNTISRRIKKMKETGFYNDEHPEEDLDFSFTTGTI